MALSSHPAHQTIARACRKCGERAGNLFLTRQLWCSGAALVTLNRALGGDLPQETAIRLAAGLGDGMGGSGCLCGGLNGGALAIGLFLASGRLSAGGEQKVLEATRQFHQRFKAAFGSACCRVLIKDVAKGSKDQYQGCAQRTATATELAARLILDQRPELAIRIDWRYLDEKDSVPGARLKMVANRLLK